MSEQNGFGKFDPGAIKARQMEAAAEAEAVKAKAAALEAEAQGRERRRTSPNQPPKNWNRKRTGRRLWQGLWNLRRHPRSACVSTPRNWMRRLWRSSARPRAG